MSGTVVLGAGVSGLAAAYLARRRLGASHPIRVLEREREIGGKVRAVEVAGLSVDTGPDSFLARATELRALLDDLGLGSRVVEPMSSGAFVWSRGRLRQLPPGAAFGLPERLWPLLRSGLLSPAGVVRAGLDLVLPAQDLGEDPSVRDVVRPRFGREVYERLVEPLLGGIHAGDAALLSARSGVPQVAALADDGGSLYRAMRRRRPPRPATPGRRPAPLVSLHGGLSALTTALAEALGSDVTSGVSALSVRRRGEHGVVVETDRGEIEADDVIVTTPAWAAAGLLAADFPAAADLLREIPYVGVANVTVAFRRAEVPELPAGTGFLVPPTEGEQIVGCSWLTRKWPHLDQDEVILVKAMVGRHGDERWASMSDDVLVNQVVDDLGRLVGLRGSPVDAVVQRWPRSMPQYVVGHAARLARLDAALGAPGPIQLTGAAYRGVGLAGCVTQASATVDRLVARARA